VSGGSVNLGESTAELQRAEMVSRVNQPLNGCYKIAMLSLKGGVGKTTITATLGSTLKSWRKFGSRVKGRLARTMSRPCSSTRYASSTAGTCDLRSWPKRVGLSGTTSEPNATLLTGSVGRATKANKGVPGEDPMTNRKIPGVATGTGAEVMVA